jgi:hypothetical protein
MILRHPRVLLSLYVDEMLSPQQKVAVEEHLHTCPACAARVAEIARLRQRLQEIAKPVPPPYLTSRILARYRQLQRHASFWHSFDFAPKVLQPAVLALLLLLALYYIWPVREESIYNQAVMTYSSVYDDDSNWTSLASDEDALRFALNQKTEPRQEGNNDR